MTMFACASPAMAYSVVFLLALTVNQFFSVFSCFPRIATWFQIYVAFIMISRIDIVRTLEGRFEEAVIAYLFIVNILPLIIIPLMWYETRKVSNLLNNWVDFEVLYQKTAGRELALNLKSKSLLIAVLLPILSCASVIITHVTMVEFQLVQIVPYCILDTLTYMMGGYWYLACETLSTTANVLAEDFQMVSGGNFVGDFI